MNTSPKHPTDVSTDFATVDFPLKPHVSPHGRITAVSMMKDEGPFVLEWVAHHLALGFTDLVVYTNDCSDGTDAMLIRLEALGMAHHRRNEIPEGKRPQPSAIKCAQIEPVVQNSDWVMVFDADEFLCIKQGARTLDSLIDAVKAADANGIVITWRIYGSSGVQGWSRAPVTEQYLHAAPTMWNKGWGVKTLFKFDPVFWKLGIHRPKIKNKHLQTDFPHSVRWLNGSGRAMEEYFKFRGWRSILRTVGYDWAQMNHYAIKSMDSYALRKLRGNVNDKKDKYNATYWALQDRNEIYDDAALAHGTRRREIMDILLGDPILADLHQKAVARVEGQLDSFKATPDYPALIADLKTAAQVPIAQVEAKPPKARDPQKIASQMSQIEKSLTNRAVDRTGTPLDPALSAEAHPYVLGDIDLSQNPPAQLFANHDIRLPADPRIFSDTAVQAIIGGKFLRNHARRLPDLIRPGDRYLEIGAGICFLAAHLSRVVPGLEITAQEERRALLAVARGLWHLNGIAVSQTHALSDTPLFHAEDTQHVSSGLARLIERTNCTVLYINDARLSAEMIAAALRAQSRPLPDRLIVGATALVGACDPGIVSDLLSPLGYAAPEEQPLGTALTLIRTG